ncbi:MAG: hypothetical protein AAFO61_05995 [Pseudomonadota bacterium]
MTAEEQALADDKMRAEIARLNAETQTMNAQRTKLDEQLTASIARVVAETEKLQREAKWYPAVVAAALLGAGAAVGAALSRAFF